MRRVPDQDYAPLVPSRQFGTIIQSILDICKHQHGSQRPTIRVPGAHLDDASGSTDKFPTAEGQARGGALLELILPFLVHVTPVLFRFGFALGDAGRAYQPIETSAEVDQTYAQETSVSLTGYPIICMPLPKMLNMKALLSALNASGIGEIPPVYATSQ